MCGVKQQMSSDLMPVATLILPKCLQYISSLGQTYFKNAMDIRQHCLVTPNQ